MEVDTMLLQLVNRPRIGLLADVVGSRAAGIDGGEVGCEAVCVDSVFEGAFGHRGSADVPETAEEDGYGACGGIEWHGYGGSGRVVG